MTELPNKTLTHSNQETMPLEKMKFTKKVINLNAIACNNVQADNFNIEAALSESDLAIKALGANNALEEMLVAQMLSIHNLQQTMAAMANGSQHTSNGPYFVNSTIKLANCFTQQANLLSKLHGNGGQKITIERVNNINTGAQTIFSNMNRGTPNE